MPKISFILPIYKVYEYLPNAINSLLNQTMEDWEAILVDDGSPDKCGRLCDEAAKNDRRFRVIHQENQGVSAARNAGLDAAKGEYIHFFDPDDYIEPTMAEELYDVAESQNADIVIFGICDEYYDADGKLINFMMYNPPIDGVQKNEPCKRLFPQLASSYLIMHKLYRRSLIENAGLRFTDHKIAEDGVFWVQLLGTSPDCIVGLKRAFYHYRNSRAGSASNSFQPERVENNFYLSREVAKVLEKWNLTDSPEHFKKLGYCVNIDLQLGIKNICLSPLSFSERVAWLKKCMKIDYVNQAVRQVPFKLIHSRNDLIKLIFLKMHMYKAVILLSSLNNLR